MNNSRTLSLINRWWPRRVSPHPLQVVFGLMLLTTVGLIVAAMLVSFWTEPRLESPPRNRNILLSLACLFSGVTILVGLGENVRKGELKSGLARRVVNRHNNPIQFWLNMGLAAAFGIAVVVLGVWSLIGLLRGRA